MGGNYDLFFPASNDTDIVVAISFHYGSLNTTTKSCLCLQDAKKYCRDWSIWYGLFLSLNHLHLGLCSFAWSDSMLTTN